MNLKYFIAKYKYTVLFIAIYTLLSINLFYLLGFEYDQPTADLWIRRAYRFWFAIKTHNWKETYVFYHPGVTVSWLVGGIVWYFPKYQAFKYSTVLDPFDPHIFAEFNFLALIPIAITALSVILVTTYLIYKNYNVKTALIFLALVTFSPFLIGNIRSIHMDAFVTLFSFLSFIAIIQFLFSNTRKHKIMYLTLAGISLGFSILTRFNSLILIPFVILTILLFYSLKLSKSLKSRTDLKMAILNIIKNTFIFSSIYLLLTYLTVYILWPTLWESPIYPLIQVINKAIFRTGLGDETKKRLILIDNIQNSDLLAHILHYPLIFLFRTNAVITVLFIVTMIASIIYLVKKYKASTLGLNLFVSKPIFTAILSITFVFYYTLIISIPEKMIFRYLLPIYPFVFMFIAIVSSQLIRFYYLKHKRYTIIIILIAILGLAWQYYRAFPYSLTYYNPFLGGIKMSSKLVNTDQASAGLSKIARDLNFLEENTDKKLIVTGVDITPFSYYFLGKSRMLRNYNPHNHPVDTDYLIVGVQPQYYERNVNINDKKYKLIKVYKFNHEPQWFLYKVNKQDKNR